VLRASNAVSAWLGFVIVLSFLRSVEIARLVRGEVLRVEGTDYLLAARALGASTRHVIRDHVLRHMLGPVLVSAAFTAASVVALEAAFGFVGLGLSSDSASWGALLGQIGSGLAARAWIVPALAAVLTTLACYTVADALDDWICARRDGPSRV
jgi:ABC-type dipeptide/oligopeptide/nickel transport system permease subunit